MTPSPICTRIKAATTQKYLIVAFCEGVDSQRAKRVGLQRKAFRFVFLLP